MIVSGRKKVWKKVKRFDAESESGRLIKCNGEISPTNHVNFRRKKIHQCGLNLTLRI